jgi:anion-transporting  ArsA/GET3 family ATPase
MTDGPIASLLNSHRVLVTCGAGGVGKTTTAAALGVAAARRGKRVLVLTIDPARRLAESLGIDMESAEAMTVDPARFAAAGYPATGSLTAMMLDTKRTFDELVRKHSSSAERAEKLLGNKLYQQISSSLAGTQEYMAMEKLVAVKDDPRFDLVILDTPPTPNALDFLDAPQKLVDALDSAAMRWFIEAFESSGKFSLNILAKSASVVLKGLGKITGGEFLADMAEVLSQLDDLFGGFKERAAKVQAFLASDDVRFLVVASPSPVAVQEGLFFAGRLRESRMPCGGFVLNQVHGAPTGAADDPHVEGHAERLAGRLRASGAALDDDAGPRIVEAYGDAHRVAARDAALLANLAQRWSSSMPVLAVPRLARDVHDVGLLGEVSELLLTAQPITAAAAAAAG